MAQEYCALQIARLFKNIFMNDKTQYGYSGKESLNRFGWAPSQKGKRWKTPAEIARQAIIDLGWPGGPYDVPDEEGQTE